MARHAWFSLNVRIALLAAFALPVAEGLAAATSKIPSKGLVAHWTFDGSAKPLVKDIAGGHDAQAYGEVKAAPGVFGKSLRFSGASSCLTVPDRPELSFVDATFSLAAWVNAYHPGHDQDMIVGKNVYSRNQREWGLFVDKDGKFRFYLRRGLAWRTVESSTSPQAGRWHHVAVTAQAGVVVLYVDGVSEGIASYGQPIADTPAALTLGGTRDGRRVWQCLVGALDDVCVFNRALSPQEVKDMVVEVSATHEIPELPKPYVLWDESVPFPKLEEIPLLDAVTHVMAHRATMGEYQFLHGAAIIHYKGALFASWANSLVEENSASEVQRARRSRDGGFTWSDVEVIAPGFDGRQRHSHGVFAVHQGQLWAFAARFGIGEGKTFPGLQAEAFVLDETANVWRSRGLAVQDCWPYDEPKRMGDGNYITGGQDKDQFPVVAISRGDDFARWDSVKIPVPPGMPISFAETTTLPDGQHVLAIIRPAGQKLAVVSESSDCGRTWATARYSNFPMASSKPYACELSTGQRCLVSNWPDRNTLTVAVTRPGAKLFSRIWRVRHGACPKPKGQGRCARVQWSYPYAHEHAGKLYVVYSIGKEDCGLSIIPLAVLAAE